MILFCFPLFAEFKKGDAVQLKETAILYEGPFLESKGIGRLPPGTILMSLGETENGFLFTEVEVTTGKVQGWIPLSSLAPENSKSVRKTIEKPQEVQKKQKQKLGKPTIPRDESILIRRAPSFIYGLQVGTSFNITSTPFTSVVYSGIGFSGGAQIGYYLSDMFLLRLEANYHSIQGSGADATSVGFGLAEIMPSIDILIQRTRIFLGLGYFFGMGIGDIPNRITLTGSQDLNSLWVKVGAGYQIEVTDFLNLTPRVYYGMSFMREPVGFHLFGLNFHFEFEG